MKKQIIAVIYTLIMTLSLIVSSCNTEEPQIKITPESTPTLPPTVTNIPPTSTFTPTPVTEEEAWSQQCKTIHELGQIGEGVINHISYSTEGNLAVVSAGGGISLYDLTQNSRVWFYPTDKPIKQSVFINNNSEILSLDEENRIIRFDTKRGRFIFSTDPVDTLKTRLSDDGSMVMLADWQGIVHVYDTTDFKQISNTEEYIRKNETVTLFMSDLIYWELLFSPDAKTMMTAAFTGRITFFDTKTGKVIKEHPLEERAFPYHSDFSADGRFVAIEYADENQNKQVRILSVRNGFLKETFQGTNPALNKDGNLLATRMGDKILIWNVVNGSLVNQLETGAHLIGKLWFDPSSKNLLFASNTGIHIWNLSSETTPAPLPGNFSDYIQIAANRNSALIALLSNNYVEIRNSETNQLVNEIPFEEGITYIALNEDGSQLAGVTPQTIIIWDTMNGDIVQKFPTDDAVSFAAFTKSPNELIIGDLYDSISLVTFQNGKFETSVNKKIQLTQFASTFDGSMVATVSSTDIISIINARDGKLIKTIEQEKTRVGPISFAPSGFVLASSAEDRSISIWNVTGTKLCTLNHQPEHVTSLAFSNDGLNLYILPQESGYVQIWGISPP